MVNITQRQAAKVLFGFFLLAIVFISLIHGINNPQSIPILIILILGIALLTWLYWRGWEPARLVMVVFIALVTGFLSSGADAWVNAIVTSAIAAVLADAWWIAGCGIGVYLILLIRTNFSDDLTNPVVIVRFVLIISAFILSRLIAQTAIRSAKQAAHESEAQRQHIAQIADETQQQATQLEKNYRDQQALLDLVAELEIPAISIAEGVIITPLIGAMTPQRLNRIGQRLLAIVHTQRVNLVILDFAGVTRLNSAEIETLLTMINSIKLLGCDVVLTTISVATACEMSNVSAQWKALNIAPTPQDALKRFVPSH